MKHFISALFKDLVDQAWTLLGMTVAWLVLEGSAKELTGNLIILVLAIWVTTFPIFRYEKEEKEPVDGDKDGYVNDGTPKQRKVKATPEPKTKAKPKTK
jgi:hypothetical protein